MPLYCASKFGMVGLVRSLSSQLAAENITINAVCPDVVSEYFTIGPPGTLSHSPSSETNIGPPEYLKVYDELKFETTKIEDVTAGFLSFLGDNQHNGAFLFPLSSLISLLTCTFRRDPRSLRIRNVPQTRERDNAYLASIKTQRAGTGEDRVHGLQGG